MPYLGARSMLVLRQPSGEVDGNAVLFRTRSGGDLTRCKFEMKSITLKYYNEDMDGTGHGSQTDALTLLHVARCQCHPAINMLR